MQKHLKAKRGATSFFIAAFVVLVLTVIMLGFARLMISESQQTTNMDLSQSAYDSSLAGVEDAKVALLKYHQCLSDGYNSGSSNECGRIIRDMQSGIKNKACDTVTKVLGRQQEDGTNGTIIQETSKTDKGGVAVNMVQAYTCVTIEEELGDYRTTIDNSSRTRIIPLRTDNVDNVAKISISWFSRNNMSSTPRYFNNNFLYKYHEVVAGPPVLGVNIFQANSTFYLHDLSTAAGANNTDRGTLYLKPVSSGANGNQINPNVVAESSDKHRNEVWTVQCGSGAEFLCTATITLPQPFRNGSRNQGASFLFLSLPYGTPETDISVKMLKANGEAVPFTGVQARIDSTGRANDLYRRVEARLELVDTYFPYPEFAIQMNDNSGNVTKKTFYTTNHCWLSNNGMLNSCPSPQGTVNWAEYNELSNF